MNDTWKSIQHILEKTVSPGLYQVWIRPLSAEISGDELEISAPNEFVARWVRERLLGQIAEAARQALGFRPKATVMAKCAAASRIETCQPREVPAQAQMVLPDLTASQSLEQDKFRYSFDDFVRGPSNELAYAASVGMCSETMPGNQLFICSSPGLGKTHLLQAIGADLSARPQNQKPRLLYLTAEEFASQMVWAIKSREMERFKSRFRERLDVLLLEDIHFLQGKPKLQDELLNTINSIQTRGCKVVFSSSFLPRELTDVDQQLASRFCSGFLAVIDKPDFQTRKNILLHKANVQQVNLSQDVSDLLAGKIQTDIRQLESCLQNLVLKAKLLNTRITSDMAIDVLRNYGLDSARMNIDGIVEFVCRAYNLTPDHLSSKSRKRSHVLARNTAYFLARKYTSLSLGDIGERFKRRHSTVLKGITSVERHISMQTPLGRQLESTISRI